MWGRRGRASLASGEGDFAAHFSLFSDEIASGLGASISVPYTDPVVQFHTTFGAKGDFSVVFYSSELPLSTSTFVRHWLYDHGVHSFHIRVYGISVCRCQFCPNAALLLLVKHSDISAVMSIFSVLMSISFRAPLFYFLRAISLLHSPFCFLCWTPPKTSY